MKATISKAKRPRYFIAHDVCIRIDNIVFAQKVDNSYYGGSKPQENCMIVVGIGGNFTPISIPCKDAIEQTALFTRLETILSTI